MKYHVINVKKSYIGETGRTLSKRIKEHKYAVCSMNMNNAIASLVHWSPCKLGGINSYWPGRTPCKKKNIRRCKNTEQNKQHEFG